MGINYNVDENGIITSKDRLVVLEAPNTFLIESMNDFPDPVGDLITLPAGKQKYILVNPIATALRFFAPADSEVEFSADSFDDDIFTYTGNDIFFTLVNPEDFRLQNIKIDNTGGSGTLMSGNGTATATCNIFGCELTNWTDLGVIKDFRFFLFRNSIILDFGTGLEIDDIDAAIVSLAIFANTVDSSTDYLKIKTTAKSDVIIDISDCQMKTQPNEFGFLIDSGYNGAAIIAGVFSVANDKLFNPAGKDGSDNNIIARDNIGQKNSAAVGTMTTQGNTTATAIVTPGTFEKLNLNALAVAGADIERWELNSSTTGGLKYVGEGTFRGQLIATISSKKASGGGDVAVKFRAVVNGVNGYAQSTEVRNTITETTYTKDIVATFNQVVEMEIANDTDSADIIVQDIRVAIK